MEKEIEQVVDYIIEGYSLSSDPAKFISNVEDAVKDIIRKEIREAGSKITIDDIKDGLINYLLRFSKRE